MKGRGERMVSGWLGGCWEDGDSTKRDPVLDLLPSHRTQGTEMLGWAVAGRGFPPGLKPWKPRKSSSQRHERRKPASCGGQGASISIPGKACPPGPSLPGLNAFSASPEAPEPAWEGATPGQGGPVPLLPALTLRKVFFPQEPEAERGCDYSDCAETETQV